MSATAPSPLRVLFVITSMPVGGAETLLVNLVRRLDRSRFAPEICCLKEPGPLGDVMAQEIPLHARLLTSKWDVGVLGRLSRLMLQRRIDAVITVGAGDKMFWGRLAALGAGVPVICSALHSTGWPDGVGRLNRLLTRWTDAFIAVAPSHGQFLVEHERFPAHKVRVIANGVDVDRFVLMPAARDAVRQELGIDRAAPVCGIVAALRPEKNHELFLQAAALVHERLPEARFLIVGDGPRRGDLERLAADLNLTHCVRFLGSRGDVPRCVAAMDLLALTSHNEANPVSILEAMAAGLPVVATNVGSVADTVKQGVSGFLVRPGEPREAADRWIELLANPAQARQFGQAGRNWVIENGSLEQMTSGYVGSSRVDLQACKLEYSIVSPK